MPFSVSCPECGTPLEVDDAHRTWKVRCPQCRHEFVPGDSPAAVAPRSSPFQQDDDHDAEFERPKRRRRRRRDHDDDFDSRDVDLGEEEIVSPAATLEWVGWISLVLILLLGAFLVVIGVAVGNQPPAANQQQQDPEVLIGVGICLGTLAIPYFVLIGIGARKCKNLSSHGWAMTAAIMAIAALPLFGLCGLPVFGPGIWALVVMNRDHVKAAFKRKQRRRRRVEYDDDDDD